MHYYSGFSITLSTYDEDNGVYKMLEKLNGNPLFGYVYLPKTERGDVANLANLLDD